ncbi:MucR family transcriptional regulator [Microvirga sp. TS319]|uniref:MucR family transcriptional regulator n=1 Tax=Microvirga sp. TS319 TaxID=3241165 RepID=UPI00351A6A5B
MPQLDLQNQNFISIAADIVSSYVANNSVQRADLPGVIASVHAALQGLCGPKQEETERPQPAIPVRKSVTPDFLISLEDGKKYKSLKRHLGKLGLTPSAYREKWSLPADYPMVAPSYAAKRSELAKKMGLGQQRKKTAAKSAAVSDEIVTTPSETAKPKRRAPAKKKTS